MDGEFGRQRLVRIATDCRRIAHCGALTAGMRHHRATLAMPDAGLFR
jgi:hypothetical protein